jgi:hypothetical protein
MELPTHKNVNGIEVPLTEQEKAEIVAEWNANLNDLNAYKQSIDSKVQALIDSECIKHRYDNIQQVTQFAAVEGEYKNEALALLDWNARVWEMTEAHISSVTEIPQTDFILTLPNYGT